MYAYDFLVIFNSCHIVFLIHVILLLINKNVVLLFQKKKVVLLKIHIIILVLFCIQSKIFWYLFFKKFSRQFEILLYSI